MLDFKQFATSVLITPYITIVQEHTTSSSVDIQCNMLAALQAHLAKVSYADIFVELPIESIIAHLLSNDSVDVCVAAITAMYKPTPSYSIVAEETKLRQCITWGKDNRNNAIIAIPTRIKVDFSILYTSLNTEEEKTDSPRRQLSAATFFAELTTHASTQWIPFKTLFSAEYDKSNVSEGGWGYDDVEGILFKTYNMDLSINIHPHIGEEIRKFSKLLVEYEMLTNTLWFEKKIPAPIEVSSLILLLTHLCQVHDSLSYQNMRSNPSLTSIIDALAWNYEDKDETDDMAEIKQVFENMQMIINDVPTRFTQYLQQPR